MSVNFIERYCYLICFATYLKEEAPKGTSVLRFKELRLHIIWHLPPSFTNGTLKIPSFRVREDLHVVDGHQGRAEGDHIPGDEELRVEMTE